MADVGMITLYAGTYRRHGMGAADVRQPFCGLTDLGALALGCLILSLQKRLKLLGQSSLLVFGASVFKVFLYDIAMAAPLIRIASLLVLGASLYLGGWLYKK